MMADYKIKMEFYRNKSIEDLSKLLADPDEKADTGSAAASVAAISAGLLHRAALIVSRMSANRTEAEKKRIDWLVRNTEILRSYMISLVDEDIRCRGPLRKALTDGDAHKIEAARQIAVNICAEVVHMADSGLEMAEELLRYADKSDAMPYILESAELICSAAESSVPFILWMGSFSSDETYRFVLRRENELNMQNLHERRERIREAASVR